MSLYYEHTRDGRSMMTTRRGRFVSNDDLQKVLLQDAITASRDGEFVMADYLRRMARNLDKLKD